MGSKQPDNRYDVHISEAALGDLDAAVSYRILIEGPNSAARLLDSFDDMVKRLRSTPNIAVKLGASGYCWIALKSYVVVYSIDEREKTVEIHRLHYGSSNWKHQILGPEG